MDLEDTPDQAEFRAGVHAWLVQHREQAPVRTVLSAPDEAAVRHLRGWQALLAGAGYAGVTWPSDHGGGGRGPAERVIVDQELDALGMAGVFDFIGVEMVGPTLMAHATPEQCARHLRPLLRADEMWCQLFSEPGAGSDLAGVRTQARRQDDGSWVVNGQKVWTTHAQHASFGIMLARTDPDAARHRGLTMFVVPMDAAGVTVRPLRQITGDAEFNEVFLDDVRLGPDSPIGAPGEGWTVALTMLGFERLIVGSGLHTARLDRLVAGVGARQADREDPLVRVRLGRIATELLALRYLNHRLLTEIEAGRVPGPEAGLAKISAVLASFAAAQLAVDVAGPEALLEDEWGHQVSALPGLRSAGGTEEILRNVIGERVLGLPTVNFALSEEQILLSQAAAQALARHDTLGAARAALDGPAPPSLWRTAQEAGWPGLMTDEDVEGAGLGALEAMLVLEALGRVLADARLLGHLPATAALEAGEGDRALRAELGAGRRRAALVDGMADRRSGPAVVARSTPDGPRLSGAVDQVLDAPGAGVLVVCCETEDGTPVAAWLDSGAPGVGVQTRPAYDATRSLAHVHLDDALARPLALPAGGVAAIRHLQRALLGAEALGAAVACLNRAREYAVERVAFGRPIGSYQAIKHKLVEMLRRTESARSLTYYAGWAWESRREEFGLASNAVLVSAGEALDHAARENIFVHGGVGATWEHDASLYYRRAELSRRLAGGPDGAADTVAAELFALEATPEV